MAVVRQPEYSPQYQPEPSPKQPPRRGHLKVVPPTKEEAEAANAGALHKRGFVESLYRNWLARVVLTGGMILGAYELVPPVRETIDNTKTSIGNYWNTNLTHKDQSISPSGTPQFQPAVSGEYITPATTGKTPEQLAKEAGYKIIYRDPNDTTGRSVFYDFRGGYDKGGQGVSYQETALTNGEGGSYRTIRYITGRFAGFENITNSQDKYLILEHPQNKDLLPKIRLAFMEQINTTSGKKPTSLLVENLSYGQDPVGTQESFEHNSLGYMSSWSENQLIKIIQSGDAIGVSITGGPTDYVKDNQVIKRVQDKPLIAASILIRRFGGKAQIEKELASP